MAGSSEKQSNIFANTDLAVSSPSKKILSLRSSKLTKIDAICKPGGLDVENNRDRDRDRPSRRDLFLKLVEIFQA